MNTFKDDLSKHLNTFSTNPYLFIGSGLSRRYLNLPTWLDLLKNFTSVLPVSKPFEYYQSKSENSLPRLASILANEFHEHWWDMEEFKNSRNKNKELASESTLMPFKIELANFITDKSKVSDGLENEISLLKEVVIDGIITTNWDCFLNQIFPDFKIYIGQQELLFSDSFSVGEIFKIHGCCSNPKSIVVTEEDYKDFNERNSYLAAKLLTVFVEHPVIFLGYSISDRNIAEILNSIVKCVDSKNIDKLQDRLIFVEWSLEPIESTLKDGNLVLSDGTVLPIKHIIVHSFSDLFEVLKGLKQRIPIKLLRKLKESFYEFVKTNHPTNVKYVGDINDVDEDKLEFVVGVGIQSMLSEQGYISIETTDIIEDLLFENKNLNAKPLVNSTIPKLLKTYTNSYLPMFKYLKEGGYLTKKGELKKDAAVFKKIEEIIAVDKKEIYYPPGTYAKKKNEIRKKYHSVQALVSNESVEHALYFIPLLEFSKINLNELKAFLKNCFVNDKLKKNTQFKKVVCLFDFLKFGSVEAP